MAARTCILGTASNQELQDHCNVCLFSKYDLHDAENNYSNKSAIQLESTLLKMASNTNLCNGVLYIFPIQLVDYTIVRYKYSHYFPLQLFFKF